MSIKDCLLNDIKINEKKFFSLLSRYGYKLTVELFDEHELKIQNVYDIHCPENQSGFCSRRYIYTSYVQI